MNELVKMYNLIVDHNEIAREIDRINVEFGTHPLWIWLWYNDGLSYTEFASFESANKWLESRIFGPVND